MVSPFELYRTSAVRGDVDRMLNVVIRDDPPSIVRRDRPDQIDPRWRERMPQDLGTSESIARQATASFEISETAKFPGHFATLPVAP